MGTTLIPPPVAGTARVLAGGNGALHQTQTHGVSHQSLGTSTVGHPDLNLAVTRELQVPQPFIFLIFIL